MKMNDRESWSLTVDSKEVHFSFDINDKKNIVGYFQLNKNTFADTIPKLIDTYLGRMHLSVVTIDYSGFDITLHNLQILDFSTTEKNFTVGFHYNATRFIKNIKNG